MKAAFPDIVAAVYERLPANCVGRFAAQNVTVYAVVMTATVAKSSAWWTAFR